MNKVLAVTNARDHRDVQTRQKTAEHLVTLGSLFDAIGDNREIALAAIQLCHQ